MCFFTEVRHADSGQSTVEAAFLIPVLFLLLLLLMQPGIVLYDRMVMHGAAAEACRLAATKTDAAGASGEAYRNAILRRLGSVPQEEHFHVHEDGSCSWTVEIVGNEHTEVASVRIANKLKPLPLVDAGATLLGLTDEDGCLEVSMLVEAKTQPEWVVESEQGLDPRSWVRARNGSGRRRLRA